MTFGIAIPATIIALLLVLASLWLVVRRGIGVRYFALTIALAVGLILAVQLRAAGLLTPAMLLLTLVFVATVFAGWWSMRHASIAAMAQGGFRARW